MNEQCTIECTAILKKLTNLHQPILFPKNHSTIDAIAEVTEKYCLDKKTKSPKRTVFLDLKKAFDTMDHEISWKGMGYSVSGKRLLWFKSYLKYRKQVVQIGETRSTWRNLECGYPQGSILGPLLFLLYIVFLFRKTQTSMD